MDLGNVSFVYDLNTDLPPLIIHTPWLRLKKKIIVSIGLTDEKNDTLKQHLNLDGSDIFKIIAEPDLASAQARSLANFDVACVVLYINSAASVKSVSQLRLNYQDSFPTLGWMDG